MDNNNKKTASGHREGKGGGEQHKGKEKCCNCEHCKCEPKCECGCCC